VLPFLFKQQPLIHKLMLTNEPIVKCYFVVVVVVVVVFRSNMK